ncbi:hypothetical protein IKQ26_03035 [bacterium]|nr:hypothetical protein [bacterium]
MFSKIKTIIKFTVIGFFSLIGLLLFFVALSSVLHSNYCIEDGYCYEGDTIFDGDIGKEIVITKEYCIENHYDWHEENKMCKLRKNNPWDIDSCLDSGVCKEGLLLKMNDGKEIIINKDTCKQYNGIWREKYNDCHFKE